MAQVIDALPVGVFILDAEGTVVYANAAAERLLGRGILDGDRAGNLSERYAAFVAGTSQPYPDEKLPIARALQGEQTTVEDLEIERDGERIPIEVTATPLFDDQHRVSHTIAVFQDITPRRRAQRMLAELNAELNAELERQVADRTAELAQMIDDLTAAKSAAERSSKAKSIFVTNISHELRTPLNHVIGFSDLLIDRLEDPKSRRLAETAAASGRDLLDKINDLIELARADTQPTTRALTLFDFDALLSEAAVASGVSLRPEQPIGMVRADRDLVSHIVTISLQRLADAAGQDGIQPTASASLRTQEPAPSPVAVLSIPSERLAQRVRAIRQLFGEVAPPDRARFHQQELDFRLAIARTEARTLGGDIVVVDNDGPTTVEVRIPLVEA